MNVQEYFRLGREKWGSFGGFELQYWNRSQLYQMKEKKANGEKPRIKQKGLTRIECAQLGMSFPGLRALVSCSCGLLMEAEKLGQNGREKSVKGKEPDNTSQTLLPKKKTEAQEIESLASGKEGPFKGQFKIRICTQELVMKIPMNPLRVNLDSICSIQALENLMCFNRAEIWDVQKE